MEIRTATFADLERIPQLRRLACQSEVNIAKNPRLYEKAGYAGFAEQQKEPGYTVIDMQKESRRRAPGGCT